MFLNKTVQKFSHKELNFDIVTTNEEQIVISPKFIGLDKNKKPFTIKAERAKKDSNNENLYKLEMPSGEIINNNGKKIFVKSKYGNFDQQSQKIFLYENVRLNNLDGLSFKTQSANIDLNTNNIYGDKEIIGINNKGNIKSKGFSITEEGNKIIFTGNTNLMIK
tara:strand:- start:127 stop:618 length:492 start_codon:yes stop_codon:yes gene_type:complete